LFVAGVVPSCVGSAAEYRVAYQLSKGNIEVAKQMSNRSMVITGITSLVGTAIMFAARHPLISAFTNDDDLSKMLIGVMPYLLLCQPLISLTETGAYLNRALAMYQRSTKIELLITCLITLPAAWVSTFIYGWDISGLTAASFVGYATMGAVILAIYNNADWDKAVRKNRKMAGTVESSKLGCEDTKKSRFNNRLESSIGLI
jgi:Na+-driven multidrug efflux pump